MRGRATDVGILRWQHCRRAAVPSLLKYGAAIALQECCFDSTAGVLRWQHCRSAAVLECFSANTVENMKSGEHFCTSISVIIIIVIMDRGVKVALGNRGVTVEAARQYAKDRKE